MIYLGVVTFYLITRVPVLREKEIFRKQAVNYLFVPPTKFLTKNGPS
jgi:hypothetical protein